MYTWSLLLRISSKLFRFRPESFFFLFLCLCVFLRLFRPLSWEIGDVALNSFKLGERSSTHFSHLLFECSDYYAKQRLGKVLHRQMSLKGQVLLIETSKSENERALWLLGHFTHPSDRLFSSASNCVFFSYSSLHALYLTVFQRTLLTSKHWRPCPFIHVLWKNGLIFLDITGNVLNRYHLVVE